MYIQRKKATRPARQRLGRRVVAEDEIVDTPETSGEGEVNVEPEATDLLFETQDVAELLAEATGEPVDVTVDDETAEVTFGVGDQEITVAPEGDEEILESCKGKRRGDANVVASKRRVSKGRVAASSRSSRRIVRK